MKHDEDPIEFGRYRLTFSADVTYEAKTWAAIESALTREESVEFDHMGSVCVINPEGVVILVMGVLDEIIARSTQETASTPDAAGKQS